MRRLSFFFLYLCIVGMVSAQTRTISGKVLSANDEEPIIGASIAVKGGTQGTISNLDGEFTINVPTQGATLVISFIGMKPVEVEAKDGMTIYVESDSEELDEVMVVAFGTTTKKAFTGSAAVVKKADIEKRQTANITNALAGQVAGVQGLSLDGAPGSGSTIRIRGVGSLSASNAPLYVVDGMPFDGSISSINTSDVESITVLKDAASAALYGSRGANGVVMITTRRGSSKEGVVSVDAKWGTNQRAVPAYNSMTDPAMYYETYYQALYNSRFMSQNPQAPYTGQTHYDVAVFAANNLTSSEFLGYNVYTVPQGERLIGFNGKLNPAATLGRTQGNYLITPDNWYNEIFNEGNFRQEYNVNFSGSSDKMNYYFSAGYLDDSGIIDNSGVKRLTVRSKVDYKIKKWLELKSNMAYANTENRYPTSMTSDDSASSYNLFAYTNTIAPIYPLYIRDANGSIATDRRGKLMYDYGDGRVVSGFSRPYLPGSNPQSALVNDASRFLDDNFQGTFSLIAELYKGLKLTSNVGTYFRSSRYQTLYNPYYGQFAELGGYVYVEQNRFASVDQQYLLTYNKTFASVHTIDALAGWNMYNYTTSGLSGSKQKLFSDSVTEVNNAINQPTATSSTGAYGTMGFIGQVNYNYNQQYYFSANFTRQASSVFAPENRWGSFWSVSAAWDLNRESFLSSVDEIDLLKLKVSYGAQGNDNIGNLYAYLDQYSLASVNDDFSLTLGYKGNRDITWETSHNLNVGVDFAMFNDRLAGTVEGFMRQTSDMLYNKPVSPSGGFSTIPVNIGSMRNSGFEIDLNGTVMKGRKYTWRLYANATYIKNKIIALDPSLKGEWISGSRIYKEGGSLFTPYMRMFAGVDPNSGMSLWYTDVVENGETKVRGGTTHEYANATRYDLGDIMPKVYGGFGTSLDFYGFDFSVSLAYQLGGMIYDNSYAALMHSGSSKGNNFHADILNAWTPNNTNTNVPRLNTSDIDANRVSDRFLVSSNYLSLQNITLGYSLPSNMAKKIKLSSVRLYCVAENVALLSARQGLDPRQGFFGASAATYSPMRSISGGVKLSF